MELEEVNMADQPDEDEVSVPLTKKKPRPMERMVSFNESEDIPHHANTRRASTFSRASLRRASLIQSRIGSASIRRPSTQSIASRGNWGSKWEFLLSCVGLSVGIGNVWRFPYLAYENGGGAFLIPYLLMLLLAGKPMYFMELSFGQFAGLGPLSIWSCLPIAKGIGYAMVTVCLIVVIYYNVIMAYTLYYIGASFQSVVPWSRCDPEWASGTTCHIRGEEFNHTTNHSKTSSQVYWERSVLQLTDGIDNLGGIKWELALCLLISWIIVVICLIKGIKTSGKVVYFAATFPYFILITLLITGLIQEGAFTGVLYFITPTWNKLLDIQVWQAAAGQMFFSLGVSMGALIMYSSYNDFRNNIFRDAMVVSILDTLTSIVSGMVIFSVLGAMAHDLGDNIEDVVASGPGLAFVAYPDALSRLPVPQLWAVLFFLMLFILGLDSEFALLENVLTSMSDEFPILRKHKMIFCIVAGIVCFFLGLPCVTRGGQYVLELMDKYGGGIAIVLVAVMESVALMWIYGVDRFCDDIKFMLGTRPNAYWRITWTVTAPLILAMVFIYSLIKHKPIKYGDYDYPDWADGIGWFLALVSIVQIPIWAVYTVLKQNGKDIKMKFKQSIIPTEEWGPADEELKDDWKSGLKTMIMIEKDSSNDKYEIQENSAFYQEP
ncbi:sodium- and chloride-dependent GABA transporter 1-like [Centruroides sculpturatus]|uniref:sodium- and chloride-dependent GABA transporter 1-like n=1 Tax=Centruroides sculpturatus TaxID=218467 RepID=UPI000C6E7B1C|nr:sodium- and chloride-dependent GABA transporter 1-like [Centruroides sculpturatus]